MYPGDAGRLGGEFVGRVVALGPGVEAPVVGERVMGVGTGTFATSVVTDAALVVPVPAGIEPRGRRNDSHRVPHRALRPPGGGASAARPARPHPCRRGRRGPRGGRPGATRRCRGLRDGGEPRKARAARLSGCSARDGLPLARVRGGDRRRNRRAGRRRRAELAHRRLHSSEPAGDGPGRLLRGDRQARDLGRRPGRRRPSRRGVPRPLPWRHVRARARAGAGNAGHARGRVRGGAAEPAAVPCLPGRVRRRRLPVHGAGPTRRQDRPDAAGPGGRRARAGRRNLPDHRRPGRAGHARPRSGCTRVVPATWPSWDARRRPRR